MNRRIKKLNQDKAWHLCLYEEDFPGEGTQARDVVVVIVMGVIYSKSGSAWSVTNSAFYTM